MPIEFVITGLDPVIHLLRKNLLRRLMDARIKSGHDECVSLPKLRIAFAGYDFAFPRRDAPELCVNPAPRKQRAWGTPGARCTRSLACEMK
jgi:hypothetical protein